MISFASLEQQQRRLGQTQENLSVGIQEHLRSSLLEYELAKAGPESTLVGSPAKEMVVAVSRLDKDLSRPDRNDLVNLYRIVSDSEEVYRQEPVQPVNPAHQPLDTAIIPTAVERFFEWVQSPSFEEIHAIEQMTLSQIRLCEIQPFPEHSHLTVSLFCLFFLLRRGYLMPLFRVTELEDFHRALEQAFLFSTEDLVRFNLRACERSYEYALKNL
jgi:hypothetical protein